MPQDSHIYRLRNLGLPVMKSSEDFANYTKLSASRIRLLHLRADKFYKVYRLPKKSGGTRLIAQPSRELKALQGWILRNILDKLRASDQSKGFEIITDEICNQCGDRVKIIRNLSKLEKRRCRDCDDYFFIETVSWSTRSFTVIDNELERDRYYYQCPSHYGKQDKNTMFL